MTPLSPSFSRAALGALVVTLLATGSANAQPSKVAPGKVPPVAPAPKADLGPAIAKLKTGNEDQVRSALDEIRIAATSATGAAPAVADLLARGLSEVLAHQAIDTLGDIESPDGSAVLAQYATHRTVALRRAAVKALTRTKGTPALLALKRALGDADPQIRGTAAAGLGALKAKEAVPDLFLALDHKVVEAAASLGQLCGADQCMDLTAKIGKLPFDVVTGGLEQVLARGPSDIPDDVKIKIIGRLRELGTAEANRFLKDTEKRLAKDASPRIRQAIEQAVKATMGGSQ